MDTTLADITRINKVLGWRPEIDVLEWVSSR